jgi:hypothetical protein
MIDLFRSSTSYCNSIRARRRISFTVIPLLLLVLSAAAFAGVTASISGTVTDHTGAVLAGSTITVTNVDTRVAQSTTSNASGFYNFAALQPGRYDLRIQQTGFKAFQRTGIVLNVNDAVTIDAPLEIGRTEETVTVSSTALRVETTSTQLGEVIETKEMTAVPLNGRSFTDLLALQPGVANSNSGIGGGSSASNTFQSGGFQLPAVSGDSNAGNQSVNGMRESANGFLLDGVSVQEYGFSGTAVVPNLESLAEFRIITNNFDAEYGNFAGGQVNVVTKAGTNQFHGNAFEFLRNTDLDAANYFLKGARGAFQQNEFGGTIGGPIHKDKVFFFADYQGNRNKVGIPGTTFTPPTPAEAKGDFSALASQLTGTVQGTSWASALTSRLGYAVSAGEPYYFSGCADNSACVFPGAQIPTTAFSSISNKVLSLGVIPISDSNYTPTGNQTLHDNRVSGRVDANLGKMGTLFGYYYFDQYSLNNPFPVATVPGFSAQNKGRSQVIDIGDTKMIGTSAVNEARIGYLRVKNNLNHPTGGTGTTLSSLGFNTDPTTGGIVPLNPSMQGIPEMDFESFNIGVPSRVLVLVENTYQASDNFSKLIGKHSLKLGGAYHYTQMAEILHNIENGYFYFDQTLETGSDFADFLLGAPGTFQQGQTPAANTRSFYLGAFVQDSWRLRNNLTFNYGLRWDVISPWWEKHNELETLKLNEQSAVFPNSPTGWVFPGDPGIPKTIAPIRYNNFAPRLGLAWSPNSEGALAKLLGKPGDTSIRVGYGMFYSAFEGAYDFSVIGDAPYGAFYSSGAPPDFASPYNTRATEQSSAPTSSIFPYAFPPNNVSASHPDPNVPASAFGVIGTAPAFNPRNRVPYAEQYELSIQRQLTKSDLVTFSYVGTQGHRLLVTQEANPVNQAECLALYNQSHSLCSPNAEPTNLRGPFGANFGSEGYFSAIGKSSYNSMQIDYRHTSGPLQMLVGYTYGKSLDTASAFGEQVNPFNQNLSRGLSSFNIPQNFVVSYSYNLPFNKLGGPKALVEGWQLSGVTTFSKGIPVYIYENDDNSLLGTTFAGPLPLGIDTPNFNGTLKKYNPDKSNPDNKANLFFEPASFSPESIGQLGNSRRRFFQGPGINNWNMALSKQTKLTEHCGLQFRAEFFNIFNHTQFNSVQGNIGSANFGQATTARDPRIGQMALKLSF